MSRPGLRAGGERRIHEVVVQEGMDAIVQAGTLLRGGKSRIRHRRFDDTEVAWAVICRKEMNAATQLVLEVSRDAWLIYDRLISAVRVKSDRLDARILAELGPAGLIPPFWVPSLPERTLRTLVHRRVNLARVANCAAEFLARPCWQLEVRNPVGLSLAPYSLSGARKAPDVNAPTRCY